MDGDVSGGSTGEPVMEGWLTRAELSGEIGVAVNTLQKWGSLQLGPVYVRVGPRVYYSRSAVRAWLLEMETAAVKRRRKLH
ncbi:hypothetical protein [Paracoccus litorisediminis]|uniref:Helix-turn-helix domain-containing protein n=1 Tax=Paracoccus litorisediminis TaxID=2006130 RepID=A0A844HV16_9RHOB|nr:hypothetical protein [Paracoccus litorisediminis]MTH62145.1 hypothetical protein [Paracoccus litorisediminis]